MALSPSGDHVAIIGRSKGERRLLIFDSTLKLLRVVPVGHTKVRAIDWAGDQALLVQYSMTAKIYGYTTRKAELSSVVVMPMDGGKPWRVFDNRPGITGGVMGEHGIVERNGRWYGYFGGAPRQQADDQIRPYLYEVDLQTQDVRLLARQSDFGGRDRDWLVDGKGEIAASSELLHDSGDWTIRNADHKVIATGSDDLGQFDLIGLTPDGAGVIYSAHDKASGLDHWYSAPLAGGAAQPYLDQAGNAEYFEDAGHRLLGYIDDGTPGEGHFFDPGIAGVYKTIVKLTAGKRIHVLAHSAGFDRVVISTEGPGDPISWWLIDVRADTARSMGASYDLAEGDVGPMRMVHYAAADGLAMEGVLTLPPAAVMAGGAAKNLATVVLPHGGPAMHDVAGFNWMAQAFASRGYAVFQPNFRGSTGYGTAFREAGHGQWGRKMQTDISDGLAELVKQGIVDPKRVCIVGASYGGYAALAGVTLQQGFYRCAAAYAPISDLKRMVYFDRAENSNYDPLLERELVEVFGHGHGQVPSEQELLAVSPIAFVDKVNVPILMIHGSDDTVVSYAQSQRMAEALHKAGKPVDFITLPGEDHWLSGSETREAMLKAWMEFVTKNNPSGAGQ